MTDKILENRMRRTLKRRGYILKKIKRHDEQALDYGRYRVIDQRGQLWRNSLVTLEEIREWVNGNGSSGR